MKKRGKAVKMPLAPAPSQTKKPLLILTFIFALIAVLLALLITISILVSENPRLKEKILASNETKIAAKPFEFVPKQPLFNATQATVYLPAVNDKGDGVMTALVVEGVPGTGRTLVDIDSLLFWGDTQQSIRIAKKVAANLTNKNVDNFDLVYNIYANATTIGGESAGAAITIGTMAVLMNKTARKDVVITGTINHDGTIGPVQGIFAKAKAAKEVNATIFLIPLLQSMEVIYDEQQHCEKFGPSEVCTTERIPKKVNVSQEAGINVVEVRSIEEAAKYFFE
jgi:predicted S18 family serine protease